MARVDAVSRFPAKKGYRVRQRYWGIIFILLLLLGLLSLGLYLFSPEWTSTDGDLPVSLRSPRRANYAVDPRQYALPPLNLEILGDALADRSKAEASGEPDSQLATLMSALNSPVPSITPLPGSTDAPTLAPSPTEKVIPTWLIYTGTPAGSPTAASTATAVFSSTPTRNITLVPTITPPPFFTATYAVVTVVPVYPTATLAPTQPPTKTMPAATLAASKTAEPTKDLPTSTPKITATPALTQIATQPPSPEPSATGYPPPPGQNTVTPPAYP